MALEQEGFRWRDDNGPQEGSPGASFLAAQDANISVALDTAVRLRVIVNHSSGAAPGISKYRLEARLFQSPTGDWFEVAPAGSPDSGQRLQLVGSSFITAGGENTTVALTPPAGSPKSFVAGRIWDDESGQDNITVGLDQYTELEFCLRAVSANGAGAGDVYQFRVTRTPGGEVDQYFSSVVLLAINESAADGSTSFDDASNTNHALAAANQFVWDDAQAPAGLTSSGLSDGSGDKLFTSGSPTAHEDFNFGTGEFTIEGWWRYNVNTGTQTLVDIRIGGSSHPLLYSDGSLLIYHAGITRISGTIPTAGVWRHFALSRAGGTSRIFVDGTQLGSDFTDSLNFSAGMVTIGDSNEGGGSLNGWIAAVRITKGVGRYTANFTPPSLPLPTSA